MPTPLGLKRPPVRKDEIPAVCRFLRSLQQCTHMSALGTCNNGVGHRRLATDARHDLDACEGGERGHACSMMVQRGEF